MFWAMLWPATSVACVLGADAATVSSVKSVADANTVADTGGTSRGSIPAARLVCSSAEVDQGTGPSPLGAGSCVEVEPPVTGEGGEG